MELWIVVGVCVAAVIAVTVLAVFAMGHVSDRAEKTEARALDVFRYLTEVESRNELAAMRELRTLFALQSTQLATVNETLLDRATKISEEEIALRKATPAYKPPPPQHHRQNGTVPKRELTPDEVDVMLSAIEGDGSDSVG